MGLLGKVAFGLVLFWLSGVVTGFVAAYIAASILA